MNITHLEYFLEVTRQGSFTQAAKVLKVSKPTISKMIHKLEDDLGVTLIDRRYKPFRITEAGENIAAKSSQILTMFHDLDQYGRNNNQKLNIGVPFMASSTFLPKAITAFKREYPNAKIQMFEFASKTVEENLIAGSLDIGITSYDQYNQELLDSNLISTDNFKLTVAPEHPLAKQAAVSIKMLAGESFAVYNKELFLRKRISALFDKEGIVPNIVCETAQIEFIIQMVANNLSVAFLPAYVCNKYPEVIALPLADNSVQFTMSLLTPKNRKLVPLAEKFVDFILAKSYL